MISLIAYVLKMLQMHCDVTEQDTRLSAIPETELLLTGLLVQTSSRRIGPAVV